MPLISVASGAGAGMAPVPRTDPDFASVVLLTHMETDPPVDVSNSAHAITMKAGAVIQSTKVKFGANALDTNKSSVRVADSDDFNFAGGPFTIEGWFNWDNAPGDTEGLLSQWRPSSQQSWYLYWIGGLIRFTYSTTGSNTVVVAGSSFTPTAGVWYHIAVDRDASDDLRIYLDGVVQKTQNITGVIFHDSTGEFSVGIRDVGNPPNGFDGVVDEVRITKGVARYGGAFTPPSQPFPDS